MARRHRRGRPVHGILLLDKPNGGSSNHALQRAKRLFGASKAGHTGSLDPLATGMLPICFGEATKLSAFLLDADKGYETTLKLGVTTNSADSDGEVLETRQVPEDLTAERFAQVCERFVGDLMQVPPMVSAIKIDGQRLYKLAREGKEVERPPRPVTIFSLEVLSFSGDSARLSVRCSKGTYIRSLVTDIGEALGCGAHVTALRRTFVCPFEQYPMVSIETLEQMAADVDMSEPTQQRDGAQPASVKDGDSIQPDSGSSSSAAQPDSCASWPALDALLLPLDAGLHHLRAVRLDEAGEHAFAHGQTTACVQLSKAADQSEKLSRVYDGNSRLLGLGDLLEEGTVSPCRVLQWA